LNRQPKVGDELKRVAHHSGLFIKTSVWHGGVSQRVSTTQLYEGLSKEFLALRTVVQDLRRRLSEADAHVVNLRHACGWCCCRDQPFPLAYRLSPRLYVVVFR
jgi:hypothetical protein